MAGSTDKPPIRCFDCFSVSCSMWRKTNDGVILCNVCHLKRTKAENCSNVKNSLKLKDSSKFTGRKGRISARARQSCTKPIDKGKNGGNKGRRSHIKKKPIKAITIGSASVLTSDSIFYKGLLYQKGDIVSICDVDGDTYFAQLRGFLQDEFCEKSAVITWLIPTVANHRSFDPAVFTLGPNEDTARPMSCFQFVSRSTNNLFRPSLPQPPFTRTHTNLNHLIEACNEIDNDKTISSEKQIDKVNVTIDDDMENSEKSNSKAITDSNNMTDKNNEKIVSK